MKLRYIQNMGVLDRVLRISIGIILMVTGLLLVMETVGVVLIILSNILIVTGVTGFCPGYIPFGISTNRKTKVVNQ